jgi:Cu(I)/Ag(I) efflux system membrane fusion protein
MWTGKRSVVYVRQEHEQGVYFSMREVTLGPSLGEHLMVESGLQAGEEIAVNGTFSIDAAAQLAGKPSMMSAREEAPAPLETSPEAKTALRTLLNAYFILQEALAADQESAAFQAAADMQQTFTDMPATIFEGEARDVWKAYQTQLAPALRTAQKAGTVAELRTAFQPLSNVIIELTQRFTPWDEPVYVQHCPMAFNDQGAAWLSRKQLIRNPYFGAAMMACGEVTAEIQ